MNQEVTSGLITFYLIHSWHSSLLHCIDAPTFTVYHLVYTMKYFFSLLLLLSFCSCNYGKIRTVKVLKPIMEIYENASEEPLLCSPRTSTLHSTTSLPRSLTAMQEYFPPSKGLGLRMFRVSTPWLFCIKYFGSSPMIILFFIQTILGWRKQDKSI